MTNCVHRLEDHAQVTLQQEVYIACHGNWVIVFPVYTLPENTTIKMTSGTHDKTSYVVQLSWKAGTIQMLRNCGVWTLKRWNKPKKWPPENRFQGSCISLCDFFLKKMKKTKIAQNCLIWRENSSEKHFENFPPQFFFFLKKTKIV